MQDGVIMGQVLYSDVSQSKFAIDRWGCIIDATEDTPGSVMMQDLLGKIKFKVNSAGAISFG